MTKDAGRVGATIEAALSVVEMLNDAVRMALDPAHRENGAALMAEAPKWYPDVFAAVEEAKARRGVSP